MTSRATGKLFYRPDLVLRHKFSTHLFLICRSSPIHVENLIPRPHVLFRVAVAIQAPLHVERRSLKHKWHLIDRTVAGRTANPLVDVDAVVEINVIGQTVDLYPFNGAIAPETLAHRFQVTHIAKKHRMAIHACFCRRNSSISRGFHARVTVPAVDAIISHMMLVAELYWLAPDNKLIRNKRRPGEQQHSGQGQIRQDYQSKHRKSCKQICTAVKNLGHVNFAPEGRCFPQGRQSQEKRPLLSQTARVRVKLRPDSFHQNLSECNLKGNFFKRVHSSDVLKRTAVLKIPNDKAAECELGFASALTLSIFGIKLANTVRQTCPIYILVPFDFMLLARACYPWLCLQPSVAR